MDPRTLQFITAACGGELLHGSPEMQVQRVCTDSRQVRPGDLFIALRGERFDGHDFLADVTQAAAVMIESRRAQQYSGACPRVIVADTRRALGGLAAQYRRAFSLPVIVVGGSNGKTTVKELVAAVLRQKLRTVWSDASFNNDIGVPLTLLKIRGDTETAVVEAGTNHPGELEPLLRMIQPDYGVITSLGREHLEFFGNLEGVVREEGFLAELLRESGLLVLPGDSSFADALTARTRARTIRVGTGAGNDWRLASARLDKQGTTFQVESREAAYAGEYRINLIGRHQAVNALFAIALGHKFGLKPDVIRAGLAECKPAKMRLEFWEINGVRVLDDAYNANADSVVAALQTMKDLPCRGRRVAVLGDMAELGAFTEAAHAEIGRRAAELGIGQLFAVGKLAAVTAKAAREAGLNRVLEFSEVEPAAAAVRKFVKEGDLLLLKASRAARLERIADLLRGGATNARNAPNGK